jgi:hypothetical protein
MLRFLLHLAQRHLILIPPAIARIFLIAANCMATEPVIKRGRRVLIGTKAETTWNWAIAAKLVRTRTHGMGNTRKRHT